MSSTTQQRRIRRSATGAFGRAPESGYVLLTLLLMVALMGIALLAVLPAVKFESQRDREEELIHRGVQYSRAIRTYYKKFGRYPTRLEELENSNNMRFLRKRYKDPMNCAKGKCEDFKLLHFGEVQLALSGGMGGQGINGASSLNSPGGQAGGLPGGSSFGSSAGGLSGGSGFGSSSGGLSGGSSFGSSSTGFGAGGQNGSTGNSGATPDQNQNGNTSSGSTSGQQTPQSGSSSGDQLSGQTFGGGPIVGVMSASKATSVREFNHKKKYNEWQFIYDPATDRGGLLMTPNQPPLQGFGNQLGTTPQNGSTPTTVGPIPGMLNNPNQGMQPGEPGTPPAQPPNQQQQQ